MGLAACIRLAAAILACIGAAFGEEGGPAARRSRCESRIFCTGPLLRAVQESGIFADGKYFVDMVGKFSEDEILEKFSFLGAEPSRDQLAHFVNANFYPPGSELRIVLPRDWREEPQFIREILAAGAQGLADFARQVHSKWKTIIRYVDTSRICPNCASSVLPLPKPFVVPGGRFREMYYWDTYWIMEGLYASEMCDTATMMVENLVWLVENYGFVPNGSRSYYLNRSQPPLLCAIMQRYMMHCLSATADEEGGVEGVRSRWLAKVLPALDAEYAFWANFRSVSLPRQRPPDGQPSTGGDEEGASPPSHVLSRYFADTTEARPESFKEDMGLFATRKAREAPVEGEAAGSEAHDLFAHIASAAESGWDFSSRWFSGDHDDLSTIETANIIPVDLNFIMLRNEQLLASFHRAAGSPPAQAALYDERALRRKEAMDAYLQAGSEWRDYNFVRRTSAAMSKGNFFLSNLAPFFWSDEPSHLGGLEATEPPISSSMSGPTVETVDELFRSHGLLLFSHAGGIPNDLMHSHQQWDFPNVWPPLQHGMICAFEQLAHRLSVLEGGSGKEGGAKGEGRGAFWKRRALQLAQKMVNTAYCGNQTYGMTTTRGTTTLLCLQCRRKLTGARRSVL